MRPLSFFLSSFTQLEAQLLALAVGELFQNVLGLFVRRVFYEPE